MPECPAPNQPSPYPIRHATPTRQVCEMTDIFEGSLVRATRRLDELMGQLANAAAAVGDNELAGKIRAAAETIRRDIMFAASLYI